MGLCVCNGLAGGRVAAASEPYYSQRARSVCVSQSAFSYYLSYCSSVFFKNLCYYMYRWITNKHNILHPLFVIHKNQRSRIAFRIWIRITANFNYKLVLVIVLVIILVIITKKLLSFCECWLRVAAVMLTNVRYLQSVAYKLLNQFSFTCV